MNALQDQSKFSRGNLRRPDPRVTQCRENGLGLPLKTRREFTRIALESSLVTQDYCYSRGNDKISLPGPFDNQGSCELLTGEDRGCKGYCREKPPRRAGFLIEGTLFSKEMSESNYEGWRKGVEIKYSPYHVAFIAN